MTSGVIDWRTPQADDGGSQCSNVHPNVRPDVQRRKEICMSSLVQPSPFLRRVLLADAAFSVAGAALMAFGAALLAGPTGIPTSLLLSAGLALFPYAAYVAWL